MYHTKLNPSQIEEGREILRKYYDSFIATLTALHQPLTVEGRIQTRLAIENIEFNLTGRFDRLDWLDDGLELIDYKSGKERKELDSAEIDLQIGLYYLALEEKYKKSLKRLSLLYLRTGEKVSFDTTDAHKQLVKATIGKIALQLRYDCQWEPAPGAKCQTCSYSCYCSAVTENPLPLPDYAKPECELQLVLGF